MYINIYIDIIDSFKDISVQKSLYNIFIENESRTDPDYKTIKYLYSISKIKEYFQLVKQNVVEILKNIILSNQSKFNINSQYSM